MEEFDQSQQALQRDAGQTAGKADEVTLQNSKALVDVLSRDSNPKMQSSKFLQFISKMSRGEIVLEDGQVGTCALTVPSQVQAAAAIQASI